MSITERLDRLPLTRFHWMLIIAIFIGVAFDNMDQITLSFVIPEYRQEWGISAELAGLHPAIGLAGTLLGAIFWGMMGDRFGRLKMLLVTIGIFAITSLIAGFAWSFPMLVATCGVMGFGVGGAVPLAFTLLAEYMPARYRGRAEVFIGILAIVGGYAISSMGAIFFLETIGWRTLFLIGVLPAGLIVWMAKVVPESPRYLLAKGQSQEASYIVERLEQEAGVTAPFYIEGAELTPPRRSGSFTDLWSGRYWKRTLCVWTFGLAWGFFNFGFLIWLPTLLRTLGYSTGETSIYASILNAIAIPAALVTALLYEGWGSKPTLSLYPLLGGVAMILLGWLVQLGLFSTALLIFVGGAIFFFGSTIVGFFTPYTAEIYETQLRGTGSGWATGVTRIGAMTGPLAGGFLVSIGMPVVGQQLIFGVPLLLGAACMLLLGIETRHRRLEELAPGHTTEGEVTLEASITRK